MNKVSAIDKKLDIALGVPQALSFHKLPMPFEKEQVTKEYNEYFDQLDNEYQEFKQFKAF